MTPEQVFEAFGGDETFRLLVDRFYTGVADDPILRPLYPEEDLTGARERLTMFLIQYWGGPNTYSRDRGHPRLRLRHAPFEIGIAQRDAWLSHMKAALDTIDLDDHLRAQLWAYLSSAADSLRNAAG
jgi:hemoglobin